jgi:hypothetical protein
MMENVENIPSSSAINNEFTYINIIRKIKGQDYICRVQYIHSPFHHTNSRFSSHIKSKSNIHNVKREKDIQQIKKVNTCPKKSGIINK